MRLQCICRNDLVSLVLFSKSPTQPEANQSHLLPLSIPLCLSFADREFYQDWWNSTSWDEFARKWNKPVHVSLVMQALSACKLADSSLAISFRKPISLDFPPPTRLCIDDCNVQIVQVVSHVCNVFALCMLP